MARLIMDVQKSNYSLYNDDCFTIMEQLKKQQINVDAVIVDPPYGTTKCKWDSVLNFEEMWNAL